MITARLVGFDRVERGLREMKRAWTRDELRDALVDAAGPVAEEIRTLAPRRNRGRIAASVTVAEIEPHQGESVRVGIGAAGGGGRTEAQARANVKNWLAGGKLETGSSNEGWGWLSRLLEFGTSKMAARPHVRPAWAARGPRALQTIREWVGDKLRARAVAAGFKVDR